MIATVVPTAATRRIATRARQAAAKGGDPYDVALRCLPEIPPDQLAAFVGLLLTDPARGLKIRPVVPRPGRCRECDVVVPAEQSRRGLCRPCYDHHRHAGTIEQFPRVIKAPRAAS